MRKGKTKGKAKGKCKAKATAAMPCVLIAPDIADVGIQSENIPSDDQRNITSCPTLCRDAVCNLQGDKLYAR